VSKPEKFSSIEDLGVAVNEIRGLLEAQNKTYEDRCKVDDVRDKRTGRQLEEVVDRLDAHGRRITKSETLWEGFFGELGAYKILVEQGKANASKLDKIIWTLAGLVLVGVVKFIFKV
jgi:DNA-binding transcriptional MerR regulator